MRFIILYQKQIYRQIKAENQTHIAIKYIYIYLYLYIFIFIYIFYGFRHQNKGWNRKFHFSLFDKRDPSPFSIIRTPDKTSNVPCSIVYSAVGTESMRIFRASNNSESFSTAII